MTWPLPTNAWLKFKEAQKREGVRPHKIPQLRAFKQTVAEKNDVEDVPLAEENINAHVGLRGRPPMVPIPSASYRQHGTLHLPFMGQTQHRCRQKGCDKKTTISCTACNMPLCLTTKRNCYAGFHL